MAKIDEECDRNIEDLHDGTRKTDSINGNKRRLLSKALEPIRQCREPQITNSRPSSKVLQSGDKRRP
ncbi:hypothetical protein NECAME_17702 [Necator americanus]|uniref:Uncharacterized protein n=1 Tax=Necator americanus TaxID=51031 RepID=W2TMW1_NECAM|nr:hypothetical protein NECAME_17702 [Necator americanus]ETN82471.1 hypothetical protein NECAME_17702 [Necator americanus]